MPRESEGFRDQLERLDRRFGGREVISIKEACELLDCCRETLLRDKTFPIKMCRRRYLVTLVALARWMSRKEDV